MNPEMLALAAFHRAAQRVPAYRQVLTESGVDTDSIREPADFGRVPILEKRSTFQRFAIDQLCVDGNLGRLGSVLTSSGHSGIFAYGLTSAETLGDTTDWIDDALDLLFQVRTRPTLLINCLPMGVKVPTRACTLAETSVRADMVVGLVRAFASHFAQIILVGEAAFVKHILEEGRRLGVEWSKICVHVILGEEPLAENARTYLKLLLGNEPSRENAGMVVSSMGVAELGLNLFFEAPPAETLIRLRRLLHHDSESRHKLFGPVAWVPSLFSYDPRRIFVEFDENRRLIVTTLDPRVPVPLIRYATGDRGQWVDIKPEMRSAAEASGISWEMLQAIPIVAISGRGDHALAGDQPVFPEAVKEGLYHDPELARLTTANFRLSSGAERAKLRIQLSPGIHPHSAMEAQFAASVGIYAPQPMEIVCEQYAEFRDGMSLDYERKFSYLKS